MKPPTVPCPGCGAEVAPVNLDVHRTGKACRHRTLHRERLALGWIAVPPGGLSVFEGLPGGKDGALARALHHLSPAPPPHDARSALYVPPWVRVPLAFRIAAQNTPGIIHGEAVVAEAQTVLRILRDCEELREHALTLLNFGGVEAVRADLQARRLLPTP